MAGSQAENGGLTLDETQGLETRRLLEANAGTPGTGSCPRGSAACMTNPRFAPWSQTIGDRKHGHLHDALCARLLRLMPLLQWQYQPAWHTPSWRSTIRDQRLAIAALLADSPSLRHEGATLMMAAYQRARLRAANETRLPEATFPAGCPWTFVQVLDDTCWPDRP